MPIKGMTDQGLSFPEIGRIRKGDKLGKNGAPRDLKWFRVEFDEAEKDASAIFINKYGHEPTEINVLLPFNEIERCWDAYLEAYTAGRMVARADGEKYLYLVDVSTGKVIVKNGQPHRPYVEGEVLGTYTSHNGKVESIRCKAAGRLKVIVPDLARAAFLTVLTGSIHDIVNISDQLRAFHAVNGGHIAGIPLVLRRRPKKISTPRSDGSRARLEKWMLSIEADPEWVKRMLLETKRLALPGNGLALLAAPAGHADSHVEEPASGEIVEEDEWEPPAQAQPYDVGPEFDAPAPGADAADSAPVQTAEPEPVAKAAAAKPSRPFDPATLKKLILAKSASKPASAKASENQVNLLAYALNMCFPGDADADADKKRHTLQKFLTGSDSLKTMPGPYQLALLDWLKPVKDSGGDYVPDTLAVKEAGLALREALKQAGQAELPL